MSRTFSVNVRTDKLSTHSTNGLKIRVSYVST